MSYKKILALAANLLIGSQDFTVTSGMIVRSRNSGTTSGLRRLLHSPSPSILLKHKMYGGAKAGCDFIRKAAAYTQDKLRIRLDSCA